jgi:hypothetical protein
MEETSGGYFLAYLRGTAKIVVKIPRPLGSRGYFRIIFSMRKNRGRKLGGFYRCLRTWWEPEGAKNTTHFQMKLFQMPRADVVGNRRRLSIAADTNCRELLYCGYSLWPPLGNAGICLR